MSEETSLEGRLNESGDREERLKMLRASPYRARYQEIYRLCDVDFHGDLGEMKRNYHELAERKAADRDVYRAWLRDITILHRLECIFGQEIVKAYVLPEQTDTTAPAPI